MSQEKSQKQNSNRMQDYGIFFQRLYPLISKISKNEGNAEAKLENKDVMPYVPQVLNLQGIFKGVDAYLKKKEKNKIQLFFVLRKHTGVLFSQVCLFNFLSRVFNIVGIEFLDRITNTLNDIERAQDEADQIYYQKMLSIYFAVIVLIFVFKTLSFNQSLWKRNLWIIRCQSICQYLLYRKAMTTLTISKEKLEQNDDKEQGEEDEGQKNETNENKNKDQKEEKEKEQEGVEADVYNLMSTDSEQIGAFAWGFNQTIVSLLYVIVLLLQIQSRLGSIVFNSIYVIIAGFFFNILIVLPMITLFSKVMGNTDKRVTLSTDVIEGIKSIKYLSWERIFEEKIKKARQPEYRKYSIIRALDSVLGVFWGCISYVFLYYFLTKYVADGHQLADTNVFTLIALFNLLTYPLGILPWSIGETFRASVHYRRIRDYLRLKDISQEAIMKKNNLNSHKKNNNDSSLDFNKSVSENSSILDQSIGLSNEESKDDSTQAIQIKSLSFVWPRIDKEIEEIQHGIDKNNENKHKKSEKQKIENLKTEENNDSIHSNSEEKDSLKKQLIESREQKEQEEGKEQKSSVKSANKGNNKQTFILKIENLRIQKGTLHFIVGRIGSGKSALLKAILNEMESLQLKDPSSNKENHSVISNQQSSMNSSMMKSGFENIKMKSHIGENANNQVILNGSIGYVSQNHWLQNKTIRDNILFGKAYNKELYDRCIEICELQTDLGVFPKGDQKIISPGGNNLSGGQRQRICLCRAIYQENDIYLFDDIFSSLDVHVADSIYEKCIQNYLIKERKATVLLVTSHYQYLEKIQKEDIILFDEGSIVTDIEQKQKFMDSLIEKEKKTEAKKPKKFSGEEDGEEETFDVLPPLLQKQSSQQKKYSSEENADTLDKKEQNKLSEGVEADKGAGINKKEEEEDDDQDDENEVENDEKRDKGKIKSVTLLTYFKSMGLGVFFFYLFFTLMMRASRTFIDFWLRNQVEVDQIQFFEKLNDFLGPFERGFRIMMFLNLGMTALRAIFYTLCSISASYEMFMKLNNFLIYAKMKFYDENPPGRIISRISKDIAILDDPLPWLVHVVLWDIADAIVVPVGILIQFPYMAIFFVITIVIIYRIQLIFRPANRQIKRLSQVNNAKVLTVLNQSCAGVMTIRAHNKEEIFKNECKAKMKEAISVSVTSYGASNWSQCTLMLIANSLLLALGIFCVTFSWIDVGIEPNMMAMTISYTILLTDIFNDLIWELADAEKNFISVERIRQFLDNTPEDHELQIRDAQQSSDQKEASNPPPPPAQNISISFQNVSLTYDDNTVKESDKHYALKKINLDIVKGEKVAFCGRTGSGKTSILNAIFSLYPITEGNIFINGKDMGSLTLRELRTQMSIIPQFGFLYNASLRDNLDPENSISEENILKAYLSTQLFISKIHKKENADQDSGSDDSNEEKQDNKSDAKQEQSLKKQKQNIVIKVCENEPSFERGQKDLEMIVEKSGSNLSNGEKQIVNFLRIMFRETEIICIDQATSNMDPKTDAQLHEQLFEFAQGKTLIVITHRLENIELFDKVVVLQKGEIVEAGHVKELRNIEGGYFNQLIKKH